MELKDLLHNQEVGLHSDPAFRGYFAGSCGANGEGQAEVMLVVKAPGQTGYRLHANKRFRLADVRALPIGGAK